MSISALQSPPPPETPPTVMTVEEFLALPSNGISRELIRGELRERGMTVRSRFHSRVVARVTYLLLRWLDEQPEPRGDVVAGEAGFHLRGTRDSLVGIDVAYVSPELLAATGRRQNLFDGPPVVAIEVLSPSDTVEGIVEKTQLYLEAGAVVWQVHPDFHTVQVHQPGRAPIAFNENDELSGDPYLPGFRVPVAALFR
jgi:Uma2 family endonuclease